MCNKKSAVFQKLLILLESWLCFYGVPIPATDQHATYRDVFFLFCKHQSQSFLNAANAPHLVERNKITPFSTPPLIAHRIRVCAYFPSPRVISVCYLGQWNRRAKCPSNSSIQAIVQEGGKIRMANRSAGKQPLWKRRWNAGAPPAVFEPGITFEWQLQLGLAVTSGIAPWPISAWQHTRIWVVGALPDVNSKLLCYHYGMLKHALIYWHCYTGCSVNQDERRVLKNYYGKNCTRFSCELTLARCIQSGHSCNTHN